MGDNIIRPCGFCGINTGNPHGYCCDECFESHESLRDSDYDPRYDDDGIDACPVCGDVNYPCDCNRDDEPADIDSDFGNYDAFDDDGRYDE